jgi:hypothetical protein
MYGMMNFPTDVFGNIKERVEYVKFGATRAAAVRRDGEPFYAEEISR